MVEDIPDPLDDLLRYNRHAWNEQVRQKNRWTVPVTAEQIMAARQGDWCIVLTPTRPVPREWFPDFHAKPVRVLCLAGGGGQQGPILAAAGARVTVFDISPDQLAQDQMVARREGLEIETVQGDMCDLRTFDDQSFDLVLNPCSNTFVPDVNPVWREAARVLKTGGSLLSGFLNPIYFLFDDDLMNQGEFKVAHSIPYSDLTSISAEKRKKYLDEKEPLCFGHTLTDQIGGQIGAGLAITGFYEDAWDEFPLSEYILACIATKSTKR
jgi:SAM-dependent methyltransferase